MKGLKKFFTMICAFVLSLYFSSISMISIQAESASKSYTIQEYEEIIEIEAEKYGIEVEILDYDNNKPITDETIEIGLNSLRRYYLSTKVTEIDQKLFDKSQSSDIVMAMPANRTRAAGYYVSNVYGGATIYAEVYGQVDLQNGYVMAVYSATSYQSGFFVNFSGWTQTGISTNPNYPNTGYVMTTVSGLVTFDYADPSTGIRTGYTSPVTFSVAVYMA